MAHIFISYAHEDRETAKALAQALADQGWSVWWDREIPFGMRFDQVIESELAAARCVIALWSKAALTSSWVREEAQDGLDRNILVPVRIETVRLPIGFRTIQTADLSGWKGNQAHPDFAQLMVNITAILGKTSPKEQNVEPEAKPEKLVEPRAESEPQNLHLKKCGIKCPYCGEHIDVKSPIENDNVPLNEIEIIALPYARDVDIFNPDKYHCHSEWTKIGQDFFRFLNYESIGILHMEKDWRIQYCVARCPNPECQGLMDVFANFTKGKSLSEMWPHLFKRQHANIHHTSIVNQAKYLSRNDFFVILYLSLMFLGSITPLYFQQSVSNFLTFLFSIRNILLRIFTDADVDTFTTFGDTFYARDKNNFYYQGKPFKVSDPKTFVIIGDSHLAKDSLHVYRRGHVVENADPAECSSKDLKACGISTQ